MKVKAEMTCGGSVFRFRLTLPDGRRTVLRVDEGEGWSRRVATRALNLLQIEFPELARRSIRFDVH